MKMYNAEVLSKFPVVQHFPFGSLFTWQQDLNAAPVVQSVHTANQPSTGFNSSGSSAMARPSPQDSTRAPWAHQSGDGAMGPTTAPWAQKASSVSVGSRNVPPTRVPWPSSTVSTAAGISGTAATQPPLLNTSDGQTRAPWANKDSERRP